MYEVAMSSRVERENVIQGEQRDFPNGLEYLNFDSSSQQHDNIGFGFFQTMMKVSIVCFLFMLAFGAYKITNPEPKVFAGNKIKLFDENRLLSDITPIADRDFISSIDREFVKQPDIDLMTTASVKKEMSASEAKSSLLDIIEAASRTHTIKPGDTLGKIARKYNTKLDQLMALNDIKDPAKITAGTVLLLGKEEN